MELPLTISQTSLFFSEIFWFFCKNRLDKSEKRNCSVKSLFWIFLNILYSVILGLLWLFVNGNTGAAHGEKVILYFCASHTAYVFSNWKLNNLGCNNPHRCVLKLTLEWLGKRSQCLIHFEINKEKKIYATLKYVLYKKSPFLYQKWAKLAQENKFYLFFIT